MNKKIIDTCHEARRLLSEAMRIISADGYSLPPRASELIAEVQFKLVDIRIEQGETEQKERLALNKL